MLSNKTSVFKIDKSLVLVEKEAIGLFSTHIRLFVVKLDVQPLLTVVVNVTSKQPSFENITGIVPHPVNTIPLLIVQIQF